MPATHTIRRYCCPYCGGHRVETLDWVTVNDDEFVGGDLGADFWCPDCENNPRHIEHSEVTVPLCLMCASHAWGTPVPLPGVWLRSDGAVERCEICNLYPTALAAAHALSREARSRGGDVRVRVTVAGLGAA